MDTERLTKLRALIRGARQHLSSAESKEDADVIRDEIKQWCLEHIELNHGVRVGSTVAVGKKVALVTGVTFNLDGYEDRPGLVVRHPDTNRSTNIGQNWRRS